MEKKEKKENFIVGIHPVAEALESNKNIEKVMFRQGMDGPQFRALLDQLRKREIQVQFAPQERLNRLSKANHQGVIAFLPQIEYVTLEKFTIPEEGSSTLPLVLILDGISDVRNFGAIARSAECAGAQGIILPAKGSATVNADSIKTSAGALLRVPICKVSNVREAIFFLQATGYKIFASTEKAQTTIYQADFKVPAAIILGSEDRGVSKSALDLSDQHIRIPMVGQISSLNVSAAAAIIQFEVLRQRTL
ncbi:MAG: 23S rRNA (guanosine(2251)-2'-O)-methyltransferase RlmB [Bacteroidales bacterium]|nr:23S rRNA (guanosine(2251)-2'-O)-methyltransferase RlmB [Bacteroidales bacterium]